MRITAFKEVRHIPEVLHPDFGDPALEEGVLYVVDGLDSVEYLCPCGCGNTVILPVQIHEDHGWGFRERDGRVTLSPSVLSGTCKAHYFIRENIINWC